MTRAPLITAIVLLLLPVLYVGSYLALVVPDQLWESLPGQLSGDHSYYPYRTCGQVASVVFWPLEQIDRNVRPRAWGYNYAPTP